MVAGSDCVDCGRYGGDLGFMGRIGTQVVEEGEISDSASVEEISEADFRKQDSASADSQKLKPGSAESRVWTMRDLYNYPRYRSGLYNLAWAQAVQNKPLNDVFVMDVDPDEGAKAPAVIDVSGDEMDGVEKEEGELEEGEIDLDSASPKVGGEGSAARFEVDSRNEEDAGTDTRVSSILETLGSVSVVEAEKSFEEVCSRVRTALESLRLLFSDTKFPTKNSINQMLFSAVQVVNSVFSFTNLNQKEQRKEHLLRLLCSVKNCDPPLLFPEQMKEIEIMVSALRFIETSNNDKYTRFSTNQMQEMSSLSSTTNTENSGRELSSVKWPSLASVVHSNVITPQAGLRPGSAFKSRGTLLPLLDLHKDHDEDSLPSPTRDAPPSFSVHKLLGVGDGIVKSGPVIAKAGTTNESKPHRYETEAFKAVSTYQQKFGRNSFLMNDMLPSPTPSEEESDDGDDDTGKEVSSFSTNGNARAPTPSINMSRPSLVSTSAHTSSSNPIPQAPTVAKIPAPLIINSNPTLKASAKSRDPRLRFANTDLDALDLNVRPTHVVQKPPSTTEPSEPIGLKNQRIGEEHSLDGPVVKRQRNTFEHIETMSGPTINGLNAGKDKVLASNPLPELLKDIAVNPDILINILKGQQQRLAAEALQKSDPIKETKSDNSILGAAPLVNVTLPKGGILQTPVASRASLMGTQNEAGTIRMKPRDPRRVLLGNTLQKIGNEPLTSSAAPLPCTMMNKESSLHGQKMQQAQAEKKPMPSQTVIQPDISRQFTKNLRNIADLVSVSNTPVSLNLPSQPEKGDAKPSVSKTEDQPSAPNAWGNVEHLFDGYDDQQKAAIQKERSRRLEEQKKMFDAHKLCLVLDLDHTLLNSAKFVEVDPVHEEILRKKEEQDREKPHRHLFRFPHMGMWTKLRPGIWTFLETASKLFEMHLYTMGNKLYATEMAKVLDPKGTLFSGRVISRGDDDDSSDGDVPKSKDLEGVLGMESAVVIIDDSVRVWPHNKLNLIVVERYTYFPCSRRQFGLPGPSLLEIDHDERPEEGTLASSLSVIGKIHQNFFSHQSLDEADVRNILAAEQRKILGGCRIVFSRVFPVSEANPHLHPLWQSAEQFGAVCTTQLDEHVTHVVANSPGTDKVNWALSRGKFAVHPGWVEASALLYRRANEQDFAIKPAPP